MERGSLLPRITFVLVLGLAAGQVFLFQQIQKLDSRTLPTEEIVLPESRRPKRESRNTAPAAVKPATVTPAPTSRPAAPSAIPAPSPEASPATPTPPPTARTPIVLPDAPVSAKQVEEIVARVLKEREEKNPLVKIFGNLEDPMTVMERELNLNEYQKGKIRDLRQARKAAEEELMNSGLEDQDFKTFDQKHRAIRDAYVTSLRNELDYNQKQKYDELVKSGKLLDVGEVNVFFKSGDDK